MFAVMPSHNNTFINFMQ